MKLTATAYTLEALIAGGIDASRALTLLADGPKCKPERPRLRLRGKGRAALTTRYVWGPDACALLLEKGE